MLSSTPGIRLLIVVAFLLTAAPVQADEPAPTENNQAPTAAPGAVFADLDSDVGFDI